MIVTNVKSYDTNTIAMMPNTKTTTILSDSGSLFNTKDIYTIAEWTIIGSVFGVILNKMFGLPK